MPVCKNIHAHTPLEYKQQPNRYLEIDNSFQVGAGGEGGKLKSVPSGKKVKEKKTGMKEF